MAEQVTIESVLYISSKRAAELAGYKQDYIGQLIRKGRIEAKRVGGHWYVLQDSLLAYKADADKFQPTPPTRDTYESKSSETLVGLDGKKYVSAPKAAELTGYHQDYVGQLARTGKVLSQQVGARWYVDIESLTVHKSHKDGLLAAVQADSVGLSHRVKSADDSLRKTHEPGESKSTHFTYISDTRDLVPKVSNQNKLSGSTAFSGDLHAYSDDKDASESETELQIPIKVIRTAKLPSVPDTIQGKRPMLLEKSGVSIKRALYTSGLALALAAGAFLTYNIDLSSSTQRHPVLRLRTAASIRIFDALFSKVLTYQRTE